MIHISVAAGLNILLGGQSRKYNKKFPLSSYIINSYNIL